MASRREIRRHVSAVVALSEPVAEMVRSAGLAVARVVPMPVPPPIVVPRPIEAWWNIVMAATLARDKGAHVLLAAFAQIVGRHPAARLVIAGSGPEERALREAAESLGDRVQLVG